MKTPIHHSHRFDYLVRSSAVALLAGSLGLVAAVAQSSSGTGTDTSSTTSGSSAPGRDSDTQSKWENSNAGSTSDTTGAGSRMSTRSSRDTEGSSSVKRSEKKFLTKVAESAPKEIAMAQLAVERASNPQVKSYAQQIISDHEQMSQQLVQLAQAKGVELENQAQLSAGISTAGTTGASGAGAMASTSGGGNSPHALSEAITSDRHYRSLSKKSGAEFDKEFVSMMVDEHKKDLKLFQEQAKDAKDSEIRSFASQNAPVLQGHLDRAQTLSQSVAE